MRIISFMCKEKVIKKILTHLDFYDERKNQQAPPMPQTDYTERVKIVPFDDAGRNTSRRHLIFKKLNDRQWMCYVSFKLAEEVAWSHHFLLNILSNTLKNAKLLERAVVRG